MRKLTPLSFIVLAACAAGQPDLHGNGPATPTRIRTEEGGRGRTYELGSGTETRVTSQPLLMTPDQALPVLAAVYQELGLPITAHDAANRLVVSNAPASRRFQGEPLSNYVDCGLGGMTRAPLANSYQVQLVVTSLLKPSGSGGSELQVTVRGTARDPIHNNPPISCSSTGKLEARIVGKLQPVPTR